MALGLVFDSGLRSKVAGLWRCFLARQLVQTSWSPAGPVAAIIGSQVVVFTL